MLLWDDSQNSLLSELDLIRDIAMPSTIIHLSHTYFVMPYVYKT